MTVSPDFLSGFTLEILTDKNRMLDIVSKGAKDEASKQKIITELNLLTRTERIKDETPNVHILPGFQVDYRNKRLVDHKYSNSFVAGFISCYDLINKSKDLTYIELDKRINEIIDRVGGGKESKNAFWDLLTSTHKHFQERIGPRPMGPRRY